MLGLLYPWERPDGVLTPGFGLPQSQTLGLSPHLCIAVLARGGLLYNTECGEEGQGPGCAGSSGHGLPCHTGLEMFSSQPCRGQVPPLPYAEVPLGPHRLVSPRPPACHVPGLAPRCGCAWVLPPGQLWCPVIQTCTETACVTCGDCCQQLGFGQLLTLNEQVSQPLRMKK